MKKLIILCITLLFSLSIINAGTTQLTSCGKSSGWLDNEVYVLNFTSVPSFYANTYCFKFLDSVIAPSYPYILHNNITFQGVGDISILKTGDFHFFHFQHTAFTGHYHQSANFKFLDLSLTDNINNGNKYLFKTATGGGTAHIYYINTALVDNLSLNNFFSTGHYKLGAFQSAVFLNSNIDVKYLGAGIMTNTPIGFRVNSINNSLFNIRNGWSFGIPYNELNTFNNSVVVISNFVIGSPSTNFYNSILKGYPHVDSNNDSKADLDLYTNMFNMNTKLDMFGYSFVQDINEGLELFGTGNKIINVEDESLNFGVNPLILGTGKSLNFDSSFSTLNMSDPKSIDIVSGNAYDCTLFNDLKCFIEDAGNTAVSGRFRGMITLDSNTKVNNLQLTRNNVNDWNIMSNGVDVLENNITITNNNIDSSIANVGTSEDDSRNLIKLRANNINLNNNVFNFSDSTGNSEYLYLDSTNEKTNKVYLNEFNNNIVLPTQNSTIFSYQCEAKLYNNYIDSNVVVSDSCSAGLNATPLIAYQHTGNKTYYFYLGNYYVDNTACVDGNSDGFCDSSYTSGVVTDTRPLSSYPFDFASHIITADFVVDNTSFDINIVEPNDLQVLEIANGNELINFTFNHNSNFPDLTCDHIIDGVSVQTITNTLKNTNHTIQANGWIEKNYTYRAECFNDISSVISTENTFTITFATTGGGGGGNETNTTTQTSSGVDLGSEVFVLSGDTAITGTTDNVLSFVTDISSFIVSIAVPLAILVSIIVVVLGALVLLF